MLELQDVNVVVNPGTSLEKKILKNLSLSVGRGEFLVVTGENGAGKSTLFNVISGGQSLASGRVVINGQDVTHSSQSQRAGLIGFVMQDPKCGTMESLSIEENLSFAFQRGKLRGLKFFSGSKRRDFFREKLSLLKMGLENRLDHLVGSLSGGQRQALSLIMAILNDSQILLLDEITAALDPEMSQRIMSLTHQIVRENQLTALMITHNLNHVSYGSRKIELSNGQIYI